MLAADVRELAESAMHLLFAARRTALEAHNLGCGGDPARVIRDDRIPLTFTLVAETAALLVTNKRRAAEVADEVRHHLHESWVFFGDADWYRRLVKRSLTGRMEEDLGLLREVPIAKALLAELGTDKAFEEAMRESPAAVMRTVAAYCDAWVARSDAGLLWRLQQEVLLQQDEQYWVGLNPWSMVADGGQGTEHLILRDVTLTLPPNG